MPWPMVSRRKQSDELTELVPSSPEAQQRMRQVRRRDTPAELALRSALHRRGLRFRVDRAPIQGVRRKADIVFGPAKVAIFVDGCFWHGCPEHGTLPKANREWWRHKLRNTKQRDLETNRLFEKAGWTAIRVWEHEDPEEAVERVIEAVRAANPRQER